MAVAKPAMIPIRRATFSMSSSHSPGGLVVSLDDDHAVANAGRLLPATLTERLGIETVIDELVDLGARPDVRPRPRRGVPCLRRPGQPRVQPAHGGQRPSLLVAVSFLRTRVGSRRRESRAGQRLPSVPYRQRGVNDGQIQHSPVADNRHPRLHDHHS